MRQGSAEAERGHGQSVGVHEREAQRHSGAGVRVLQLEVGAPDADRDLEGQPPPALYEAAPRPRQGRRNQAVSVLVRRSGEVFCRPRGRRERRHVARDQGRGSVQVIRFELMWIYGVLGQL